MNLRFSLKSYAFMGLGILAIDQYTKHLAFTYLKNQAHAITSFVSLELIMNRGISWGMLSSASEVQFYVVTLAIAAVVALLMYHCVGQFCAQVTILGEVLVLAGALSNLIDRIVYHGVIDFISVAYSFFYLPPFICNIADISISIGLIFMLFSFYRHKQIHA